MDAALRQTMTIEEFLAWEDRQELRYEFDGFQPVAMTGGTAAHAAILRNILFSLTGRLRGQLCQPYGSELKIKAAGRIRYPDAFVVCTPVPPSSTVVTDPVIVFEVISNSSLHEDLVIKNAEYRATRSIQRYVVLQQTDAGAIVFARKGEDWISEPISGADALIRMPEIGIEIPLTELYIGIDLAIGPDGANP
jgi:Uma2 family endonuclease